MIIKYLAVATLVLLFSVGLTKAQENWHWQNPLPSSNNYGDIAFADSTNVTIVGSYGTIFRSTDAGRSWTSVSIDTKEDLVDVCFASSEIGYCVDRAGNVYRSVNGGQAWKAFSVLEGARCGLPAFWNVNLGVFVGWRAGHCFILRTIDGGASWIEHPLSITGDFSDIEITPNGVGIIVGDDGMILRSSDTGKTWQRIITDATSDFARAILSNDGSGIILTRSKQLLTTVDSGSTWITRQLEKEVWGVALMDSVHYVGSGRDGFIAHTSDRGFTWQFESDSFGPRWQVCASNTSGIAIGIHFSGVIRRSTDFGQTWKEIRTGTTQQLNDVSFSSELTGNAVGVGVIVNTINGGRHWETVLQCPEVLEAVDFSDETHGIAVGWGHMYHTSDGGMVWTALSCDTTYRYTDVESLGAGRWIVTTSSGTVMRSETDGSDWTPISVGSREDYLYSVDFVDDVYGMLVGNRGIYRTFDGGLRWESVNFSSSFIFGAIAHVKESMWIVVGQSGRIQITYDDGNSWSEITSGTSVNLTDITVSSDKTIYIVGGYHIVLEAEFGIESLHALVTPSHDSFNAVEISPSNSVYIVGNQGTIISNSSSGVMSVPGRTQSWSSASMDEAIPYPNPSSDYTTIPYHVTRSGSVLIEVVDAMGSVVAQLVDSVLDSGKYEAPFPTHTLASGSYVVRIQCAGLLETHLICVVH